MLGIQETGNEERRQDKDWDNEETSATQISWKTKAKTEKILELLADKTFLDVFQLIYTCTRPSFTRSKCTREEEKRKQFQRQLTSFSASFSSDSFSLTRTTNICLISSSFLWSSAKCWLLFCSYVSWRLCTSFQNTQSLFKQEICCIHHLKSTILLNIATSNQHQTFLWKASLQ